MAGAAVRGGDRATRRAIVAGRAGSAARNPVSAATVVGRAGWSVALV